MTDGGIANLGELLTFFYDHPECRPTIIHTSGFSLALPGYDQETNGTYGGITVYRAHRGEDIVTFTRKAVRQNLLGR